jgi:uncharacterized repeat protein (TIGR03803 family)
MSMHRLVIIGALLVLPGLAQVQDAPTSLEANEKKPRNGGVPARNPQMHKGGSATGPDWSLTTLYSFCSQTGCTDGTDPTWLIQGTDDNFYGTTAGGGANGGGTFFKMTPGGTLTTLHSFCSQSGCTDGENPFGEPVEGTDGNFYGTTYNGGANGQGGTAFKITPGGTLTTLHSFCSQSCTDGSSPVALIQGTDGNFYGTTPYGGANGQGGTVFKITPNGNLTTLYSFCSQTGCTDGTEPRWLIQGTDGNFYGTTQVGGANNEGTVFKITPNGTLTMLYSFSFCSPCTEGFLPGALVQGTDGNFYGTTYDGGATGGGTIFQITPSGTLTTLYSFLFESFDSVPGMLLQGSDGNFYGTTYWSGGSYGGTVFRLTSCTEICTFTDVTSSLNPSQYGSAVTFAATVTGSGTQTPTGSVSFTDGGAPLGVVTLAAGVASLTTSTLADGTHTITATYSGNATFDPSMWSVIQTVGQTASTTTLDSNLNPSLYYQPLTLTATVVPTTGAGTCTGAVTFANGSRHLGTATLAGGVASFMSPVLGVGTYTITASYSGDTTASPVPGLIPKS